MELSERLRGSLGDGAGRNLLVGTAGTLALNVTTLGFNIATTVLLSRVLGAEGYGAYAFAFAWAILLTAFAGLGLNPLVVRTVAAAAATRTWGPLRGMLRWANAAIVSAAVVTIVAAGAIGAALMADDGVLREPYLVGLLLIAPLALTMVRQSAMQGLGKVVLGRVPESVVAPALFLLFVLAAYASLGDSFSATWALVVQLFATIVAFGVGVLLLVRSLPRDVAAAAPEVRGRDWSRAAIPFFLIGLLSAAGNQIGTVVLGVLGEPADVGVFSVATRMTSFVGFLMLAATYPLMPLLASIHATGDLRRLQAVVTNATRAIVLVTVPIALVIAIFAEPLLALFGSEFRGGDATARILVAGELLRMVPGVGAVALLMSGNERDLTLAVALNVVTYVVLAILLVPGHGAAGAAIAQAVGLALYSSLIVWLTHRHADVSLLSIVRPGRSARPR